MVVFLCCTKNKFILLILVFLFALPLQGQNLEYAREVIERLCAPDFHGRGYVGEGDRKAAEYIASQFSDFGLSSYQKEYFQNFKIPANTFPGDMEVLLDQKALIAGIDYLANPCSPSVNGTFKLVEFSKKMLLDPEAMKKQLVKTKGKFILINKLNFKQEDKENSKKINEAINYLKYSKDIPASGIVELTDEKLTWHAAMEVCNIPSFTLYLPEFSSSFKTITCKVENKYFPEYSTQNVIGYIKGTVNPDSAIVFSAHYDHLGRMGRHTYFPGANDNGSGTALLLDLARHYSLPENAPENTIVFMAFGAEEIGLLGSRYYVQKPLFPLGNIKFLINLDIAGTGDEGITVVNGSVFGKHFNLLKSINDTYNLLPTVKKRGEACNSDHCMFHLNKVPSFFIYTLGGIQAYHDVHDIPETLPLTKYEAFFKLLTYFTQQMDTL